MGKEFAMRKYVEMLNLFVAVAASFAIILLFFWTDVVATPLKANLTQGIPGALATLLGIGTILLNLFLIIAESRAAGKRQITIESEGGPITIATTAVEAQLLEALAALPDIADPRVTLEVRERQQPIQCLLTFKLQRQDDIPGRLEGIKGKVREAFSRLFSGRAEIEIVASVTDLLPPPPPRESSPPKEFTGPVYPTRGFDAIEEEEAR